MELHESDKMVEGAYGPPPSDDWNDDPVEDVYGPPVGDWDDDDA
jgi:hypothetical protein